MTHTQLKSSFRKDLNLLRALAVIAVVLFHFGLAGVTSGFVGVDIFFVISGYLMITIILSQIESNSFSFFAFMEMRFRRIFPALILVVVSVIFFEWFITPADTYMKHTRQALAALFFVSNIAFGGDNGYFAQSAQTKPLLHTWSLSIEWQFYFFLALMAKLISAKSKVTTNLTTLVLILLVVSLGICLFNASENHSSKAYFQLTARSWEMLVGGIFALAERNYRNEILQFRSVHSYLRFMAWVVILICCILPWDEKMWPGLNTLIPTIATGVLVVRSDDETTGFSSQVFEFFSTIFHRIGLTSYSIYLWHWPIYVIFSTYALYHGIELDIVWKLILLSLTLIISYLSYFYYEDPIRKNSKFWTSKRLWSFFGLGLMIVVLFVAFVFLNKGLVDRLPSYAENAQRALVTGLPRDECFQELKGIERLPNAHCLIGHQDRSSNGKFIVLGDSLTHQFVNSIDLSAQKHQSTGLVVTKSGCRMLANLEDSKPNNLTGSCRDFNVENWQYLKHATDIKYAVVSGGYNEAQEIIDVIDMLSQQMGKRVIFIMPTIKIDFKVPEAWMLRQFKEDRVINTWTIPSDDVVTRKLLFHEVESYVKKVDPNGQKIKLVNPMSVICENGECFLVKNGQSNFRDQEHISNVNSNQYQHLFDDAFDWLFLKN